MTYRFTEQHQYALDQQYPEDVTQRELAIWMRMYPPHLWETWFREQLKSGWTDPVRLMYRVLPVTLRPLHIPRARTRGLALAVRDVDVMHVHRGLATYFAWPEESLAMRRIMRALSHLQFGEPAGPAPKRRRVYTRSGVYRWEDGLQVQFGAKGSRVRQGTLVMTREDLERQRSQRYARGVWRDMQFGRHYYGDHVELSPCTMCLSISDAKFPDHLLDDHEYWGLAPETLARTLAALYPGQEEVHRLRLQLLDGTEYGPTAVREVRRYVRRLEATPPV